MDVCQTDLVIMEKHPPKRYSNKTYFYILTVMDVFSRYIFLKPLQSKESVEVASHLREIFFNIGVPNVTQCNGGSEFKVRNFKISCYIYFSFFQFHKENSLKIGDDRSESYKICLPRMKYRSFVPMKGPRKLCILINSINLHG